MGGGCHSPVRSNTTVCGGSSTPSAMRWWSLAPSVSSAPASPSPAKPLAPFPSQRSGLDVLRFSVLAAFGLLTGSYVL